MNVLFLGNTSSRLIDVIRAGGDKVTATADRLDALPDPAPDWIVSYGYRHILRKPVLDRVPGRAINLHISLLPWNRGADPNLWSWIDNTPKGVTIHLVDEGVDTGAIVAQREVRFVPGHTLATSYAELRAAMDDLFRQWWPRIRAGHFRATPQRGPGTSHRSADRASVAHLLTTGWDTRVAAITAGSSLAA